MASVKRLVSVRSGGSEVQSDLNRPIRLTPDGYAGVVFAGSVFPLYPSDVIDIDGASWEIADCERFLIAPADVPYAPSARTSPASDWEAPISWTLESNGLGHFVLFDASERQASDVVAALEAANLSIQRWDVSHRQAGDGRLYDWFARLRFKGRREELLALVEPVFEPAARESLETAAVADPTSVRLSDVEARVEELSTQTYEAGRRAAAAEREVTLLRSAVAAATERERESKEAVALAERHWVDLKAQLFALRETVGKDQRTAQLVNSLADAEELRELALAENASLLERLRVADLELEQERRRVADLTGRVESLLDHLSELQTLENDLLQAAAVKRPRRGGLAEFLPVTFPRIKFILDAVEAVAALESPASVMRALSEIEAGVLIGKDLEGIPGWFEVSKLATGLPGSYSLGRIYYKPQGVNVLVSVHIKQDDKQQRRHIGRLKAF